MPAICVGTDRVYGSSTFSSSAITHVGRDREAEPHRGERPHLRVRAHDDERAVVVDQLERAPRRELAVGLVDDEQRPDLGRDREQPLDRLARLDGAGRVVGAAHEHDRRARRLASSSAAASGSIAKSAPRSPTTTSVAGRPRDLRVQRVRRLEHQRAPAGAAVGEQQRLQHLVAAVRAEQPLARLAEERAERGAQLVARRDRDSGASRRRAARRRQRVDERRRRRVRALVGVEPHGTSTCGEW